MSTLRVVEQIRSSADCVRDNTPSDGIVEWAFTEGGPSEETGKASASEWILYVHSLPDFGAAAVCRVV
jgi:hypothetical protein